MQNDPQHLRDKARKEAQGEIQKRIGYQNMNRVFMAVAKKPSTISDLLKVTGFPKPTLYKHLESLQKHRFIHKDTIKPNEKSDYAVGTIVYRNSPYEYEDYFRQAIATSLQFLNWNFHDKRNKWRLKKEIEKFVDSSVNILLDDLKVQEKKLFGHTIS